MKYLTQPQYLGSVKGLDHRIVTRESAIQIGQIGSTYDSKNLHVNDMVSTSR